ncbi:MAG: hypothetical protein EOM91_16945 [Sphingobacteriia bacterium]|nr:hypothetical protein [Sphingobacteriia bacterium]NCC41213.1 hypothetical protein [Gammaproteobacteria bacterium]
MAELRRDEARDAIPIIDAVLARCGGRRIGEATTLGTLTIETTAEGIQMLRRTASVKSVIRDQPVTMGHSISRFSLTDSTG